MLKPTPPQLRMLAVHVSDMQPYTPVQPEFEGPVIECLRMLLAAKVPCGRMPGMPRLD